MMTDRENFTIGINTKLHMVFWLAYLYLTWPILKVKVMHISNVNISKMITDRENLTITIKYEVAYGLSISIFRFDIGLF